MASTGRPTVLLRSDKSRQWGVVPQNPNVWIRVLQKIIKNKQNKVPAKVPDSRASVLNRWSVLRSDLRSETLVRSLAAVVLFGRGDSFSIAICRKPPTVSLRFETLAGASPKFWLRSRDSQAQNRGTLNCERTVHSQAHRGQVRNSGGRPGQNPEPLAS